MSSSVSRALRRLVETRADRLCEYCLIHEDTTFFGCEVDHILSEKRGGPTEADNLAYACFSCNHYKGTDIGSVLGPEQLFVRFFHPRRDRWGEHFELQGPRIAARTSVGMVTARILHFNDEERAS